MKTSKKEIIQTTREQQQRHLMNWARVSVSECGRQFEPRMNDLSLVMSIREDTNGKLKEKFGDDVLDKIEAFSKDVSELVAYYSDIKKKVIDKEDVSSGRFLKYKEALSLCFKHLFFIDKIIVFLVKGTDFEELTIPSSYFLYVSKEEFKMPEEGIEEEYGEPPPKEQTGGETGEDESD